MVANRRIVVKGRPRLEIDPLVFLQVLLAIDQDEDDNNSSGHSVDVFDAAIEDSRETADVNGARVNEEDES